MPGCLFRKYYLSCESLKCLQITHAMETKSTPSSLTPSCERSLHGIQRKKRKKNFTVIQFGLCLQCVTFCCFANTSSMFLCWSSHLKAELMYWCTLRKKGVFQDKAGHCLHFCSFITLRLLSTYCLKTSWYCKCNPSFMTREFVTVLQMPRPNYATRPLQVKLAVIPSISKK